MGSRVGLRRLGEGTGHRRVVGASCQMVGRRRQGLEVACQRALVVEAWVLERVVLERRHSPWVLVGTNRR